MGKCNLLLERGSTRKAPQKDMKWFLQPLKSILPHLVFQARAFWLTQKRVHCNPCLSLTALQQWGFGQVKSEADTGKKVQDVFPHLLKEGKTNLCHKGWKKSHFWEHTVHCLLDSLFIWLFNSVHDFCHVVRYLVFIFNQMTNCLKVWVFWSNT